MVTPQTDRSWFPALGKGLATLGLVLTLVACGSPVAPSLAADRSGAARPRGAGAIALQRLHQRPYQRAAGETASNATTSQFDFTGTLASNSGKGTVYIKEFGTTGCGISLFT